MKVWARRESERARDRTGGGGKQGGSVCHARLQKKGGWGLQCKGGVRELERGRRGDHKLFLELLQDARFQLLELLIDLPLTPWRYRLFFPPCRLQSPARTAP
jgi:hypothetical protein